MTLIPLFSAAAGLSLDALRNSTPRKCLSSSALVCGLGAGADRSSISLLLLLSLFLTPRLHACSSDPYKNISDNKQAVVGGQ